MTQTRYQHTYLEDPGTGTYLYDCVGFVSYTLSRATPIAYQALVEGLDIKRNYVPSPPKYVEWISGLAADPVPSWVQVPTVAEIQPGDMLDWPLEGQNTVGTSATGNSVIAAGPPLLLSDGSYALLVYDSTASFHGPFDTRRSDPRNLPLEIPGSHNNGNPSGLGRGTLQLLVGTSGAPTAVAWTVATAATTTTIAIGRALA